MMKTIQGDLIKLATDGKFDVIIHGCNCQCDMGAGIAKVIRDAFPKAFEADCQTKVGDHDKLGNITQAIISINNHKLTIVNGYTQYHWKGNGVLVDYDALRSVMKKVKEKFSGKRIGYPKIGAGLAGGDWNIISQIIDEELYGEDQTLVEFSG